MFCAFKCLFLFLFTYFFISVEKHTSQSYRIAKEQNPTCTLKKYPFKNTTFIHYKSFLRFLDFKFIIKCYNIAMLISELFI